MNTPILDQSEKVKFWIENDILFCKFSQVDCYLSEEGAKAYLSIIKKICQGKSMPLLIDIRNFIGNFSPTAAKIFANSPILNHHVMLQAFVADTLNSKLLISSYVRIYAKDSHVKIFNDFESALAYCIEYKNKFLTQKN